MRTPGKRMREARERAHARLAGWTREKAGAAGRRWRVAARVRLANRWAGKHPKMVFALTAGSLALLLALGVLPAAVPSLRPPASAVRPMPPIVRVDTVFGGFRSIQDGKERHAKEVTGLTAEGEAARAELDSLLSAGVRTRGDSARAVMLYGRLERIVDALENKIEDKRRRKP